MQTYAVNVQHFNPKLQWSYFLRNAKLPESRSKNQSMESHVLMTSLATIDWQIYGIPYSMYYIFFNKKIKIKI